MNDVRWMLRTSDTVIWFVLSAGILVLDFYTGPLIQFPILFVLPVAFAALRLGRVPALALAVALPAFRAGLEVHWGDPWSMQQITSNGIIRVTLLVLIALLVDRTVRQRREIRVLRGMLPICAFCKRIRDADGRWHQVEVYITRESEALFTHTYCPECAKRHYGAYLTKARP
ncbi:MAG: hypothetical protein AB1714_08920 [Acidobacteriota bacterium]